MANLNKVQIIGNLVRDPEIKVTQSNLVIARVCVATNLKMKEKEETEFHNVTIFGKLAEICQKYLHKGKQVYFEGRLKTTSWEDKETRKKMYRTEIIANEMQMLGGKSGNQDRGPAPGECYRAATPKTDSLADDLPF